MKAITMAIASGLMLLASQVNAANISSLDAVATGNMSVQVSWVPAGAADYYDVYQNGLRVESLVTGTSVDISGLQAGTEYKYFVTSCTNDGVCSVPSGQVTVRTDLSEPTEVPAVCPPAVDGSAPVVALTPYDDGTALLSWCEVSGAEGYNLFLNNDYEFTFSSDELSALVDYDGSQQYQVAWFGDGNFPPKSAVAAPAPEQPGGETDLEILMALDALGTDTDVEIYFTRHAEKETELEEQEDGSFVEICGDDKCAEILNAKGELRAELLRDLFNNAGVTARLTHAFSSHKNRTRQTIEMIVADAGLTGDVDKNPDDGIQEFPVLNDDGTQNASELDPEGTSASEAPVIEALLTLAPGSVALVAGHSGTLYDIMAGLGLDDVCLTDTVATCNQSRYPIDEDVKVRDYGDIWKVNVEDGVATFIFRANFQPAELALDNLAQ